MKHLAFLIGNVVESVIFRFVAAECWITLCSIIRIAFLKLKRSE